MNWNRIAAPALTAVALWLSAGCEKAPPKWSESGIASFYSEETNRDGTTASGEAFDDQALTAAHRTLPFNSMVEVTNVQTQQRVTVRINDRGPFTEGRVIDLSLAAAERLGMIEAGLVPVTLLLKKPGK